jgi:hypothetical protein
MGQVYDIIFTQRVRVETDDSPPSTPEDPIIDHPISFDERLAGQITAGLVNNHLNAELGIGQYTNAEIKVIDIRKSFTAVKVD